MLDPTPFAVGGGAEHSPEVLRNLVFASTSGAEGITEALDLRVLALPTPGNKVRVMTGSGLILNRYAGGTQQTYSFRNMSETQADIVATGSGAGRTDLVVMRIEDPQYAGQAPADPTNFNYVKIEVIQGVSSTIKDFKSLNRNYPAIPLARINVPASTSTITQAMITDLRKLANPRTDSKVFPFPTTTAGATYTLTSATGERFPDYSTATVDVPLWATRMQVRCDWVAVKYLGTTKRGENWVKYGPTGVEAETQHFQWDPAENGAVGSRDNWICADDVEIPSAWRGTTISLRAWARVVSGTGGSVTTDPSSGLLWDIRFLETPAS